MKAKRHSRGTAAARLGTAAELEKLLGHRFARPELLERAITHRSFAFEAGASETEGDAEHAAERAADPSRDNEQLEFLGDAVLGLVAADSLCRRFPLSREGELTRLRANLVSRRHLGEVGSRMELGRFLRLGETAERSHGRENSTLAANALEALIAALYLDGGLAAAQEFIEREVLAGAVSELERSIGDLQATEGGAFSGAVGDHKSALQELVQAEGLGRPRYVVAGEDGPDHRRTFRMEVRLEGAGAEWGVLAEASGPSKRQAQQEAARLAVERLRAEAGAGRARG